MIKVVIEQEAITPNRRTHWAAKAREVKLRRESAYLALWGKLESILDPVTKKLKIPVTVKFIRGGPRFLDKHDNLPSSLKPFTDGVADAFKINDNSKLVDWIFDQEKSQKYYVRIEIYPTVPEAA